MLSMTLKYLAYCDDRDPYVPPTFEGLVFFVSARQALDKDSWAALKDVWDHRWELSQ